VSGPGPITESGLGPTPLAPFQPLLCDACCRYIEGHAGAREVRGAQGRRLPHTGRVTSAGASRRTAAPFVKTRLRRKGISDLGNHPLGHEVDDRVQLSTVYLLRPSRGCSCVSG